MERKFLFLIILFFTALLVCAFLLLLQTGEEELPETMEKGAAARLDTEEEPILDTVEDPDLGQEERELVAPEMSIPIESPDMPAAFLEALGGLKGRDSKAQGKALGPRTSGNPAPTGRDQGRDRDCLVPLGLGVVSSRYYA